MGRSTTTRAEDTASVRNFHLPGRPLHVLYHHRTQGRGAEGNHIVSVVSALRQLGHQVRVISPGGVDPFSKDTAPVDKASTKVTGISRVWRFVSRHFPNWLFELAEMAYNIPAYFRVSRELRAVRYDLVYERYAFFLVAGAFAAARHGVPFLLEVNEVSGVPERARKQSFMRLCNAFERMLFRRCSRIHAVSSYLADRAREAGASSGQLAVVPNGFDMNRIPATPRREELRRRFGLDGTFVLGFAGWFDDWDRLSNLVEVMARILKVSPDFRLCLIGDGRGRAAAAARAAELGIADKIIFTGAVARAEVYDYLSMLDVGVLPNSNMFGSPMIMFEMMGLGIPLVLPRLPPIEDVHKHGQTALLFEPLNVEECSECVLSLFANVSLRERIAAAAKTRLLEEHSWIRTVEKILDLEPPA
ncbi:glycosyltransferase family 4 protein [Sulfuricaulis limicola]|uniref:glycosyltransferase family 4 protein n=1 Tax=Sulfuricaulis limicola TaxID=1620215 RepID=UPI000BBA68BA|nr:glycosyltransferase family 4 protein [Sulfuricaulis limicola]